MRADCPSSMQCIMHLIALSMLRKWAATFLFAQLTSSMDHTLASFSARKSFLHELISQSSSPRLIVHPRGLRPAHRVTKQSSVQRPRWISLPHLVAVEQEENDWDLPSPRCTGAIWGFAAFCGRACRQSKGSQFMGRG